MISFFIFIFVLGFLILVHELGHFLLAKKFGVKVEEFSIGFPPTIWKKKKGETIYSLGIFPLGGFVKLFGETPNTIEEKKDPKSFYSKALKVKLLIVAGGVIANFLVAVFLFYLLLIYSGFSVKLGVWPDFNYDFPFGRQENLIVVFDVAKNSPAQKSGLKPNDIIVRANQRKFSKVEDFVDFVYQNKGKKIFLVIKDSKDKEKTIEIIPRKEYPKGEGPLGVKLKEIVKISYPSLPEKILSGFLHSLNLSDFTFYGFSFLITKSFQQKSIQPISKGIVGPVGILAITKLTLKEGFFAILNLIAIISLTLALINFFPFPALDGGKAIFLTSEFILGKEIPPKIEQKINLIGFLILIFLMVLITYKDIIQFGKLIIKPD